MEQWEIENFERLKAAVGAPALQLLNADQLRTLQWLAGLEYRTIDNLCSIFGLIADQRNTSP